MKYMLKTLSISLVVLGIFLSASGKESPYVIGDLQPGEYNVGFRVLHQYNHWLSLEVRGSSQWLPLYLRCQIKSLFGFESQTDL